MFNLNACIKSFIGKQKHTETPTSNTRKFYRNCNFMISGIVHNTSGWFTRGNKQFNIKFSHLTYTSSKLKTFTSKYAGLYGEGEKGICPVSKFAPH